MPRLIIFSLFVLCLFIGCQEEQKAAIKEASIDKYEEKFYPYYERDLVRSFPDKTLNIEGFERGKKQVQADIKAIQNRRSGFDLPWTIQGPTNIGARINTVAIDPTNDNLMLAGYAGGGLWRTVNGGSSWEPVFESEIYNSISDITFDPKNPGTIYVGTGDANVPGRAFMGNGVYKSTDYGESWTHMGLGDKRIISKVIIHPEDSDVVYAGSMGLPFTKNDSRGLYKSADAGNSWEKAFYISDSTGISDFIINPSNPELMYVATWDRVRNDTESLVFGDGSGIYVSSDSGENWDKAVGIPDTMLSRTGLAICEGSPNHIYAVTTGTDLELDGIYHSSDFGMTFEEVPLEGLLELNDTPYEGFGWYFAKLGIDPQDPNHIYLLAVDLWESYDLGQSWNMAAPVWWRDVVHADKHEILIDANSDALLLATDGGLFEGFQGGTGRNDWDHLENIPTTQFYRVGYNPHAPDMYYGGAQDNGTVTGNLSTISEWYEVFGGDGFQPVFNPIDANHWFVETQNGSIYMSLDGGDSFDRITNDFRGDHEGSSNWDTPYFLSSHNPLVLYMGRDTIYKASNSYAPEWEPISGNLTDGGFPSTVSKNISALDESPIIPGKLYAGTSNGLLHITMNDGGNWELISEKLPNRYVSSVKASPSEADRVFVTFSGYKFDDFIPRVFRSDDNGQTWINIAEGLPDVSINDILIIPGYEDRIIFVATDGGIYGTSDHGENWSRIGTNMPNIVCYDMDYNVANQELVAATFGRSIMTYPIEQLLNPVATAETADKLQIKLYPNPTQDYLTLEFENQDLLETDIQILDASGQRVLSIDYSSSINVSQLVSGNYYCLIRQKNQVFSQQFSKI